MKIAIVGAGILGQLLALRFNQAKYTVTLYDPDNSNNCSMAAAGLLTPIAELEKSDPLIHALGTVAMQTFWPDLLAELYVPVFFKRQGSLLLSHAKDVAELQHVIQLVRAKLIADVNLQQLNNEQIKTLEPELIKFQTAYFFSEEGQVDSQALLAVLKEFLIKNINWINRKVDKIEPGKITIQDDDFYYDLVCDCRGLAAQSDFSGLRAVRGELLWLHAPTVRITRPIRVFHPRYRLYIVPRENHIYLIGASEIEAYDLSAITVRTTLELLTAAYYVHAGFAEASLVKTVSQCRPTLSNHLPKIKYADRFLAINGLYRHGFLISPALVNDIFAWTQRGLAAVQFPQLWEREV